MIKGINVTNLCTLLDIFSLLPVAPIFPLQSWSHHEITHNIILYCWTYFIMLLKCYKSTDVIWLEPQTMKISHYIFISQLYYWIYFISLSLYRWTHFITLLKCYKSTDVIWLEPQTMKVSHYIFMSQIILLNIFYFIIIVPLYLCYYAVGMLSAH